MNTLFAIAVPILPGKTEQWRKFSNALNRERKKEFAENRRMLGIRERSFLQTTPQGDMVLVTFEGENPQEAFANLGKGNDDFTRWFAKEVNSIHGIDITTPPSGNLPEIGHDSGKI
jgi:hypothetical protein